MDIITYALARKYTDQTVIGLGGLKGAPCTISSIVHQDGHNIVTFEWTGTDGSTQTTEMIVDDGTPIYPWTSGNHYEYGNLVIYESSFYKCITPNSDVSFDGSKWEKIGAADGSYDIVANSSMLPTRFTQTDRKLYYSIEDRFFWLWDGYRWEAQKNISQFDNMPTPSTVLEDRIIQYVGNTDNNYTQGFFYKCVNNNGVYTWEGVSTQQVDELTLSQLNELIKIIN